MTLRYYNIKISDIPTECSIYAALYAGGTLAGVKQVSLNDNSLIMTLKQTWQKYYLCRIISTHLYSASNRRIVKVKVKVNVYVDILLYDMNKPIGVCFPIGCFF